MAKRAGKFEVTILTLFPEFIESYKRFGIVQRALKQKLIGIEALYLRKFGLDARGTVDDRPYGGGVGMVLRPDVMYKAIQSWKRKHKGSTRVILLTPQGKRFGQADARSLVKYKNILLVSGRYEGFDERIRSFVDEELSLGDYVLMGGELPALAVTEAIIRLIPGVLGKLESTEAESFAAPARGAGSMLLEYPQYTKPEVFIVGKKKLKVPKVLLTGHHANINKWRAGEALKRTKKRRPDLLKG